MATQINPGRQVVASGTLGVEGRRAAIAATLDLVGRYLATGENSVEPAEALAWDERVHDGELNTLLAVLRLRVALAASDTFSELLRRITLRPTFRYQQRAAENIGHLSGPLDVNRYVAQLGTYADTPSFPVLEVYRSHTTPENVLALYAGRWLIHEMRTALKAAEAPTGGPEHRAWTAANRRLRRHLSSPEFASCSAEVVLITRRSLQRTLVATVRQRLHRGEIANPSPYSELIEWVERILNRKPLAEPGQIQWTMYGEWFDSRLFELWCLRQLGAQLSDALNQPIPEINSGWRSGSAVYHFEGFYGTIDVHYQRRLGHVDPYKAKWSTTSGEPLIGIPDILVVATPPGGPAKTVLLDPKLKQSKGLPTQDTYKVLGYIENFPLTPPAGFVLSHITSTAPWDTVLYRDGGDGVLGIAKLNPAAPTSVTTAAVRPIIDEVLRIMGMGSLPRPSATDAGGAGDPIELYAAGVSDWMLSWGKSHAPQIASVSDRIAGAIGLHRWTALDDNVRIMVATADFIGYNLSGGDFSGPVIGLCAALERILHTHVIEPALASAPPPDRSQWSSQLNTFGAAIATISSAAGNSTAAISSHLRSYLITENKDQSVIRGLVPKWRTLNKKYRIPAAHRDLVAQDSWQSAYGLVIGAGTLLADTIDALVL